MALAVIVQRKFSSRFVFIREDARVTSLDGSYADCVERLLGDGWHPLPVQFIGASTLSTVFPGVAEQVVAVFRSPT